MGSGEEFGGTQMALVVGGLSLAEVYKVAIIAVAVVVGLCERGCVADDFLNGFLHLFNELFVYIFV